MGSYKLMLVEIMSLVFLMTCLMVVLTVFGAWRRKSRSYFLKVISYTTSTALVPFILGLIQDAPFKNELLIIWGMLLLIGYAFPDSFSAYSPEDVTQSRMHYIQFLVKVLALALLWSRRYSKEHSHLDSDSVAMFLFTMILILKAEKRSFANFFAIPSSIEERAKFFEVYMTSEHNLDKEINPVTMRRYNYMVKVMGTLDVLSVTPSNPSYLTDLIKSNVVVTLQMVWKCEGRLLTERGDPDNRLKDICLSYSLLKILYLKCAGYALVVRWI